MRLGGLASLPFPWWASGFDEDERERMRRDPPPIRDADRAAEPGRRALRVLLQLRFPTPSADNDAAPFHPPHSGEPPHDPHDLRPELQVAQGLPARPQPQHRPRRFERCGKEHRALGARLSFRLHALRRCEGLAPTQRLLDGRTSERNQPPVRHIRQTRSERRNR